MSIKEVCSHMPFFPFGFVQHMSVKGRESTAQEWLARGTGKVIWRFVLLGHLLSIRLMPLVGSKLKLLPFGRCAVKWVGVSSTAGGGQVSALSRELRNGPDTEHRLHSPSCRWSIHVTVKAHGQDHRGELRTPKPALPLSLTAAVCVLSVKSLAYKF